MTEDNEWKQKLIDATQGKTGVDLASAKKRVFQNFAAGFPDEYAWKDGSRRKPAGTEVIASKIQSDMKRVFGDLYDPSIAIETSQFAAAMYY